jgi:cellulose synthase/poly-beta-1,6-N-acetylglucosamine synthase-like glycosyltransferase
MNDIKDQHWMHYVFYALFGIGSSILLIYYLSNTIIHFTTPYQFPVNSFSRFPLSILIFPAELFSILFGLYFVFTLFTNKKIKAPQPFKDNPAVAILLPVHNEPGDIVERTIRACKKIKWRGPLKMYLLDDSNKEESIEMINVLAKKYGFTLAKKNDSSPFQLIRRPDRNGFKAGNINNALKKYVTEEFFVILDADQAPSPQFLEETMDYFSDATIGFVQTPQHFINDDSPLERAQRTGNAIFFHSQTMSKTKDGAMPFCGTNVVVRTIAFEKVKGFSYYTATEDIDLGIRMNASGFYGAYVPQILVEGYSPRDFKAYSSQQYRWANGNLAILRESWYKIITNKNFSLRYQIHTLFTLGWWFIGIVSFLFMIVPIISLLTGWGTHHTWLPTGLLIFLYLNIVFGIGMIYMSTRKRLEKQPVKITDALLQYSLITNSMFIYMKAAFNALLKRYIGFVRTNKTKEQSGIWQIKWNLLFGLICFSLSIFALYKAAIAVDIEGLRSYLPVSLWLLFFSLVMASSLFFVGSTEQNSTKHTAQVTPHD